MPEMNTFMEISSKEFPADCNLNCGVREVEVLEDGVAEGYDMFQKCKKNPGHKNSHPVKDFKIEDLPKDCRDQDLYDLLKVTAELTVSVIVNVNISKRTNGLPGTNDENSFEDYTEKQPGIRMATGRLWSVELNLTEADSKKCWCTQCQLSSSPNWLAGRVWLCTANHVFEDIEEARNTYCRLFYDTEESPVVTLGPWSVKDADAEEDRCLLTSWSCDRSLLERLATLIARRKELWWKLDERYRAARDVHRLVCIVSHPHGVTKRISVGRWQERQKVRGDCVTKYVYDTSTCPGSSGAYVYVLGCHDLVYPDHVHSKALPNGYNLSGTGRTMKGKIFLN